MIISNASKPKFPLKTPDSQTKQYIAELKKQNAKLNRKIAKLEVQNLDCENRVKALKNEIKTNAPKIHIDLHRF